jgi:hypothetical protein
MKLYILVFSFSFALNSFGQGFVFDTTIKRTPINSATYYSETNFLVIDTIHLWKYLLDTTYHGRDIDSIKPIGQLIFWRTKPIDDSISKFVYNQLWTPYITFDIFTIADTNYCYDMSTNTRFYSSCVAPDVGGDIIIIDKYLFLNNSVCLSCERHDTKIDYCRPVINYVFSNIDKTKITTIESLVQQFVITRGQLPKREKRTKNSAD